METTPATSAEALKIGERARRYTELTHRTIISQAVTTSALELPEVFGHLKEQVFRKNLAQDKTLFHILEKGLIKGATPEKDLSIFAKALAEQAAINVETVVSAAAIVLSHSTADDVFTGVCQLAMELDPNKWIAELNFDKKIALRDLKDKGRDGVFATELETHRSRIGGKSLPTRAGLLFKHVRIRHHKDIPDTSPEYFRASMLKNADDLRNEIIHGGVLPQIPVSRAFEITTFLHEAASTAIRSLGFAYAITIDAAHWQELLTRRNPGAVLMRIQQMNCQ
jgi:hypothetical protein